MKSIIYEIEYTPSFLRTFKRLNPRLQEEIEDTLEKLKYSTNHEKLKVYKLNGRLKSFYSCSVNYKYRIIFEFKKNKILLIINSGDHSIYN